LFSTITGWPVLDDHRLAVPRRQLVADQPRERVDDAARGERHDDADRTIGIGLGLRAGQRCGQRGSTDGGGDAEDSEALLHGYVSWLS